MVSRFIYENVKNIISVLDRKQVLDTFKCHNITEHYADLNIDNMCVTILFTPNGSVINENVELWEDDNYKLHLQSFNFSLDYYAWRELFLIQKLYNRLIKGKEKELIEYFKHFCRSEVDEFLHCIKNVLNIDIDKTDLDDIIDKWIDLQPY